MTTAHADILEFLEHHLDDVRGAPTQEQSDGTAQDEAIEPVARSTAQDLELGGANVDVTAGYGVNRWISLPAPVAADDLRRVATRFVSSATWRQYSPSDRRSTSRGSFRPASTSAGRT